MPDQLAFALADDLDRTILELDDTQTMLVKYREMVSVCLETMHQHEKTIRRQTEAIRRFMSIVEDLDRLEATE